MFTHGNLHQNVNIITFFGPYLFHLFGTFIRTNFTHPYCAYFGRPIDKGKQQHGFTKNKSTATAGLLLQSLIARALDNDCYVALAGIDLSAAFDVVDIDPLVKRLQTLGLPNDIVQLIKIWQLPSLKATLKQKLISTSAKALKIC